ncbi:MAG TPA: hypothetical protein VKB71_11925, partial [Rhizomicrobium sp.]|nr:hypothetical protein [Rhizomicrobium sp.]
MSDRTQLGVFAVVMAIATAASAAEAPGTTDWYAILTERGTQIGHASHEVSADGTTITDDQVIDVEDEESPSTPLAWRTGPRVKTMSWHTVQ